ncbi:hypothetical protein ACIA5G_51390 [Amycolatopsis sp. NPDC051758]|uniref:hypothetical protein n=1 Tax=Amycolatopsis sp. NPDC051758 TaxID=3363935 RepID=UPI0037A06BDC
MPAHRDPAMPIALGQHWTFHPRRPAPDLPVLLQVEQDRVTALPYHRSDTIGLEVQCELLDKDVAVDLADHLLALPGVEVPDATRPSGRRIDIPVVAPSVVLDTEVVWPVTAELSVHHANYDDSYLALSTPTHLASRTEVQLTGSDAARLIVALASLLSLRSELTEAFTLIAAAHRRSLRRQFAGRTLTR